MRRLNKLLAFSWQERRVLLYACLLLNWHSFGFVAVSVWLCEAIAGKLYVCLDL